MSGELEAAAADVSCCASCGKAALDDVKLKKCACNLVQYCSVECQKNHRSQHKKACKQRMAEIRDDRLFTQPDGTHYGECPICCLPLPLQGGKSTLMTCCGKLICKGCSYGNQKRQAEQGLIHRCAFCREPPLNSKAEHYGKACMKRAKANDPVAMNEL